MDRSLRPDTIADNRVVESYRKGYPRFSAFLQSDRNFILFRRFGQLHARVLLHKQDIICELEQRLNRLDNEEANSFFLNSRRNDQNAERRSLLADIESKLLDYGLLLIPCSQ